MMLWMILLGVATGMRTMTPIAAICWFMWFALLPVTGLTYWTASFVAVLVFTVFALGEYYGDTLATAPSRKNALPLVSRLVFGVLVGVIVASTYGEPLAGGILLTVMGVLIGAFGGYRARMYFADKVGRDFPVAVCESALALGMSVAALVRIRVDILRQAHQAVVQVFQRVS
jgi:uncharacterized membrane protein